MPAAPKPKHARRTKTRKERGKITQRVAEEVLERAGGVCERCGLPPVYGSYRDRLELAHLEQKSQGGRGDIPWNVAALCGPSVNTNTCHWHIDSRRKDNRDWIENKIAELKRMYVRSEWTDEEEPQENKTRYCCECSGEIPEERDETDLFCSDECERAYRDLEEYLNENRSDE